MTPQKEAEAFRVAAMALDPELHAAAIDDLRRWADEAGEPAEKAIEQATTEPTSQGDRLCELRRRAGLNQKTLSEQTGIHRIRLSKLETGLAPAGMRVSEAVVLADLYGVTLDALVGRDPVITITRLRDVAEALETLARDVRRAGA